MPPETRGGRHSRSRFSRYDEESLGKPIIAWEPKEATGKTEGETEETGRRPQPEEEKPESERQLRTLKKISCTIEELELELRELRAMKKELKERRWRRRRSWQRRNESEYLRCRIALGQEEVWVRLKKGSQGQVTRVAESIWGLRAYHGMSVEIEGGAIERWRGKRISLSAEETEESGSEVTFRVKLHREEITVRAREGETAQNLEDTLGSRFWKEGIRLINASPTVEKNWQGTTKTAVVRMRGGTPEEEEEGAEEEAEWESEEETRIKMENLDAEERDLREMARKQFELTTAIRTMAARARAMIGSYDERWRVTIQMEILRQDIERLEQDVPRLMEEYNEHLDAAMKWGKKRVRAEEGLIPREVPAGYAKCQLRFEGEERWIMARPGREEELL
jgi:hypothetical protein